MASPLADGDAEVFVCWAGDEADATAATVEVELAHFDGVLEPFE